jgi:hypothetical protein
VTRRRIPAIKLIDKIVVFIFISVYISILRDHKLVINRISAKLFQIDLSDIPPIPGYENASLSPAMRKIIKVTGGELNSLIILTKNSKLTTRIKKSYIRWQVMR